MNSEKIPITYEGRYVGYATLTGEIDKDGFPLFNSNITNEKFKEKMRNNESRKISIKVK